MSMWLELAGRLLLFPGGPILLVGLAVWIGERRAARRRARERLALEAAVRRERAWNARHAMVVIRRHQPVRVYRRPR